MLVKRVSRHGWLWLTGLLVGLAPWGTPAAPLDASQEKNKNNPSPVKIPFKLSIGQILVEIKVNGKGPFTFVVDTGTNITLIVPESAKKMGFAGGQATLTMEGLTCKHPLKVMQVLEFQKLPPPGEVNPDGIIGADFLQHYLCTFDFKERAVTLASLDDTETRKKEMDPEHTLPVTLTYNLPYADVWIEDKGPYSILLDTGSNLTAISKAIGRELKLQPPKGKRNPAPKFGLKNHTVEKLQVVMTDPPAQGVKSGKNGSVGNNYFCQFRTTFDLKRKEVCLVPNGYVPDYKDFVYTPSKQK